MITYTAAISACENFFFGFLHVDNSLIGGLCWVLPSYHSSGASGTSPAVQLRELHDHEISFLACCMSITRWLVVFVEFVSFFWSQWYNVSVKRRFESLSIHSCRPFHDRSIIFTVIIIIVIVVVIIIIITITVLINISFRHRPLLGLQLDCHNPIAVSTLHPTPTSQGARSDLRAFGAAPTHMRSVIVVVLVISSSSPFAVFFAFNFAFNFAFRRRMRNSFPDPVIVPSIIVPASFDRRLIFYLQNLHLQGFDAMMIPTNPHLTKINKHTKMVRIRPRKRQPAIVIVIYDREKIYDHGCDHHQCQHDHYYTITSLS